MTDRAAPTRRTAALRFLALVGALAVVAVTVWSVGLPDTDRLTAAVADAGAAAPVIAVAGYAVGVAFMVPRTFLSIASGLLFGWLPGFAYAIAGALLGASLGFGAGRVLGREYVAAKLAAWGGQPGTGDTRRRRAARWLERRLSIADGWLARHGIFGMWMVRLIPVAHFGVTSYACGTAAIRYRHFLIGTLIGALPGSLGYTAVGASLLGPGGVPLALLLSGCLVLISVGLATWARRRQAGYRQTGHRQEPRRHESVEVPREQVGADLGRG